MKRFFSIFSFLLLFSFFSFPSAVKADCVCYDVEGDAVDLPDSSSLTTDEECRSQCILEVDENAEFYEDGKVADNETLSDVVATQVRNADSGSALPDGACNCFCGTKGEGAIAQEGAYSSSTDCQDRCDSINYEYTLCAYASGALPLANGLCWSQADCEASNDGVWDSVQPAECAAGDHYCYPPAQPVELAVHIGETTTVLNIGTYINLIYTYGLGAASAIAIVMIMIGGAQYIIGSRGGGGSEEVSKAKDRIKNASTGLVLLLLIYVILYAVNPALTVFKTIELPRIKPSLFIQGSCEDYESKGYTTRPSEAGDTSCGDDGIIARDPNGVTISKTCKYESCAQVEQACINLNNEYSCMTCEDAGSTDVGDAGFNFNSASCSALSPTPSDPNLKYQCQLGLSGDTVGFGEDICVLVKVDCSSISKCSDYGNVLISRAGSASGYALSSNELNDLNALQVCYQNPCREQIGEGCIAVDVEELAGHYQSDVVKTAAKIEEQFETNNNRRVDTSYVLTTSDYQANIAEQFIIDAAGTYATGYSDVGCVPQAAVTNCDNSMSCYGS